MSRNSAVAKPTATDEAAAIAQTEARRLAALRLQLLDCHPFWGHLLLHVRLVPAPQLPSFAATDCARFIWYNPNLTRHLDLRQLGFVLAHEIGHHVFESIARRDGRDPVLWNCATDYAINRMVANIRGRRGEPMYRLPNGTFPGMGDVRCLHDAHFDGMTAEQIYLELQKSASAFACDAVVLNLPGEGGDKTAVDHGGGIDVHLPTGLSDAQRDELLDRLVAAVATARAEGKGDMPVVVERYVDSLQAAKVPWQRLLARFVGESQARQDYSYARPNRRWLLEDILVPGLHSEDVGRVVVAVDTSASISAALLGAIASEIARLYTHIAELTVLIADTRVHAEVPARELPAFLAKKRFVGGGGTDHRPVFEWIAKRRLEPELFIGVSDLFSKFPAERPRYPVLWVAPTKHGRAPWGGVVEASL